MLKTCSFTNFKNLTPSFSVRVREVLDLLEVVIGIVKNQSSAIWNIFFLPRQIKIVMTVGIGAVILKERWGEF